MKVEANKIKWTKTSEALPVSRQMVVATYVNCVGEAEIRFLKFLKWSNDSYGFYRQDDCQGWDVWHTPSEEDKRYYNVPIVAWATIEPYKE